MAYQLQRTNISLTGNMKVCCHVSSRGVENIKLRPVISRTPEYGIEINNENLNFRYDLVNFYKKYSNIFYTPYIEPYLNNDRPLDLIVKNDILKKYRVNGHEYGVSRSSTQIEGNKYHIFAPIFIKNYKDIPYYAKLIIQQHENGKRFPKFEQVINISKDTTSQLYQYLFKYIEGVNDVKFMNISHESRESLIVGRSVESGELSYIKSDIPVQLFTNDLTFVEFNSKLSTEFSRFKLITPHIINLDFYFDINNINPNISKYFTEGKQYSINLEYYNIDNNKLDLCDIDFNHENISNEAYKEDNREVKESNILNFNHEHEILEIQNNFRQKLIPYINKWVLSNNDTYIFNNYIGFNNFINPLTNEIITQYGENKKYAYDFQETKSKESSYNLEWFNILEDMFSLNDIYNDINNEVFGIETSDKISRVNLIDDIFIFNGVKYSVSFNTTKNEYFSSQIFNDTKISINIINSTDEDNTIIITKDYITDEIKFMDFIICIKDITTNKYINPEFNNLILNKLNNSGIKFSKVIESELTIGNNSTKYKFVEVNTSDIGNNGVILGGNSEYINVLTPSYIKINNPLTCTYINSVDDNQLYLTIQTNNSINISRYNGWIQPRFIAIEDNKSIDNNFIFYKNKSSESTIAFSNKNTKEHGYSVDIYDNNLEYKFFKDSKIINLPTIIKISKVCKSETSYNIYELFQEYFSNQFRGDLINDNLLYIYNLYDVTVTGNDSTLYIDMKLK